MRNFILKFPHGRGAFALAVVFSVLGLTTSSPAQAPRPGQPGPWQQPPTERISGTVKDMKGALIQLTGENGAQWVVKMPSNPRSIRLEALADSTWLQPGMWVRFTGRFNARGQSQGTVSELEVFTPRESRDPAQADKLGVFPDASLADGELFADPETKKKQTGAEIASFKVAGRLTGARGGKINVQAGNMSVQAELAEKCTVTVNVNDGPLALQSLKAGDVVHADGWSNPAQKSEFSANYLRVKPNEKLTVAAPLSPADKKKKPAAKASGKE